jgi:hypothetical protein
MATEDLTGAGKFIDDLVATNPVSSDLVSSGDEHLRGVKNVLKNSFGAVTGAVTATHTELNYTDGVTSAIQTQINGKQASDADLTTLATNGIGTSANQIVQLDAAAKLPEIDGSQLTGIDAGTTPYTVTDATTNGHMITKAIEIIPNAATISGTWDIAGTNDLRVMDAATIDVNGETLTATATISGNHIFYASLSMHSDAVITVTGSIEGFGDTPAAGSGAALTAADVTTQIAARHVFGGFGL